jgi:Zn-dependent peptidase ImmA (M78 family)
MIHVNLESLSQPERLLWNHGVRHADHIDLDAIANAHGAKVKYRCLDGCAARLVTSNDQAIISVHNDDNQGRKRFSLGHELAHWICDAKRTSFKCSNADIGPQNDEAKNVEANANVFSSQLVLPDYLVSPWIHSRKVTLDVAKELAEDFRASLTASALKLMRRAPISACIVNHDQQRLRWFQKNSKFPHDFFVVRELHQDTAAFTMAFGAGTNMSRPTKEPANRWLSGPDAFRNTVTSQSLKQIDGSVLTLIAFDWSA